ncbi:MAG TPA: hypothetical protein VGH38_30245 [Bryobacteraceae bacterium]
MDRGGERGAGSDDGLQSGGSGTRNCGEAGQTAELDGVFQDRKGLYREAPRGGFNGRDSERQG